MTGESEFEFDLTPIDTDDTIVHQLRIDLAAGSQLVFATTIHHTTSWMLVAPSGSATQVSSADAMALITAQANELMLEGVTLGRKIWVGDNDGNIITTGVVVRQDGEYVSVRPDDIPASATENYTVRAHLRNCKFKD